MNKKIILKIIIVLLLSMYIFSLLFLTSIEIEMKYSLTVKSNNNYQLKIPYPHFPHDNINDMKINNTEHGIMYEFDGCNVSDININSKKVSFLFYHFPDDYFELSTIDLESGRYANVWLFSNENVTISFNVIFIKDYPNSGYRIKINYTGVINPGFNLIKMEKQVKHSDSFCAVSCFGFSFNAMITVISLIYINRLLKRT